MIRLPRRVLYSLLPVLLLPACATASGDAWFEDYCRDKGLTEGTVAFSSCVQETKTWVEWTQWRSEHVGKGL